jgi:hypothetical protein
VEVRGCVGCVVGGLWRATLSRGTLEEGALSLSPPGRNTAGKFRVEGIGDALLYL